MKTTVARWRALLVSAGLSALFLIVYGGCNWIAAHRAHVSSFYFEWERHIPFVPLLIPAYMSLDLFFVGAPFLCLTGRELRAYSFRIVTAILVAGVCFLVFPLKFGFDRPSASGVLGFVFDWFREFDAPYNLVPSLHAALLLLVGEIYVRRLRGFPRYAAIAWFVLIGLSPVLTYQHHVIDIATGFGLAAYCFYLFPERNYDSLGERDIRLGFYYAVGALVVCAAALLLGGWSFFLLWPAGALAIVAGGYWWFGPSIYRKTDGTLPWSTRFVLAPCLLGQELSRIFYRRQCRPWDLITPQVWIGSRLGRADAEKARRAGVTAVLDLTAEFSEAAEFREIAYGNIPVLDLTAPTEQQLHRMSEFITEHSRDGIVYVHCKIGYSRSAAAIGAWLLASGKARSIEEVFLIIYRARPSIIIRGEVVNAFRKFVSTLRRNEDGAFVLASAARAPA
ncbi:MAG TPA: dual specificity protein phosphatase family protein [Chthoniobacterales bacterium]|nr:dual specificity protein phosphatase family protein [Chthoniobacterales bacterium]